MQVTFKDKLYEDLYELPLEVLGKQAFSKDIIKHYRRKIDILKQAVDLRFISKMSGLRLKKLEEERYRDCFSIRVNDQYRIIFTQGPEGAVSVLVIELNKHYE